MEHQNQEQKKSFRQSVYEFYDKKYKKLLIIPFLILLFSLGQIAYQMHSTGDFLIKDISLKGGVTVTIPYEKNFDASQIEKQLHSQFPHNDIVVRTLRTSGTVVGLIIEADIDGNNKADVNKMLSSIGNSLSIDLAKVNYGIEIIGSSLGASFFRESISSLYVAFLFMGLVVFLFFGTNLYYKILCTFLTILAVLFIFASQNFLFHFISYVLGIVLMALYFIDSIPSLAIIIAAFSDIVFALAVVNLMGMRIGTAGIAAFLMLIGYSVDTDILLSVRVLKRKEGSVMDRIISSIKTGMTETMTALVAVVVAMFVTQSDVIRQIMIILFIGLIADIFNTWIQNVGLLRLYVERQAKKGKII